MFFGLSLYLVVAASGLPRQVPVPIEGIELEDVTGKWGRAQARRFLQVIMTGDDAATATMTGREQKALRYLCVVLNGLLLIIAPKFASERGIAQLAFWLKWRRWAAGSFGQAWPEVCFLLVRMFGPAEHFAPFFKFRLSSHRFAGW